MDYKVINQLVQRFRSKSSSLVGKTNNSFDDEMHSTVSCPKPNTTSSETIPRDLTHLENATETLESPAATAVTSLTARTTKLSTPREDHSSSVYKTEDFANTQSAVLDTHIMSLLSRLDRLETRLLQINRIHSLSDLISRIYEAFETDHLDVSHVEFLMESYVSNVDDWKHYANFDDNRYTRNLVDDGNGKFNLILLCWSQGQSSSIHDHAQAHCFMKMLQGSLTEVRYRDPNLTSDEVGKSRPLSELSRTELNENDVCYINDSIGLHKVGNSGPHPFTVSLHLYSPPFQMCSTFDPRTGQKSLAQMSFWSKFGKRV